MDDFEQPGAFYLGKPYDLAAKSRGDDPVLYASKDLTTHAVCVGMTGSGKTGLCISLLEEAVLDGIPSIVIDPKGDLTNLLLTFPGLSGEEFSPWLSPDLLAAPGVDRAAVAATEADRWAKGLAEWGEDGARIGRLRAAAEFTIYTPGSDAGVPISVLGSFDAPDTGGDRETLGDAVEGTATGLLSLLGIDADPVQSREHILISSILSSAWTAGQSLDLPGLIAQVQAPPFAKVGVLDLEAFYPQKDRFGLAMRINNLLAAPGFEQWMTGEPLDVQRLLFGADGRPRVAVVSISHLSDQERMFFVSLLLNAAVTWMRRQPGTSSLRALIYMDEVFGYFPPVAEPPSKKPLLTLLKQARAAGLGIVLATQNPADLDYKGLSNTGTWLIGRLQADRDKQRLLDGLEGAAPGAFDRAQLDTLLSSLTKRIFLLHNVNSAQPKVFESRWALSYLRGPLTRDEVKTLMADRRQGGAAAEAPPAAAAPVAAAAAAATAPVVPLPPVNVPPPAAPPPPPAPAVAMDTLPPTLPPGVEVFYAPRRGLAPAGAELVYVPMVVGGGSVNLRDAATDVDETRDIVLLAPITDSAVPVDWQAATDPGFVLQDLGRSGEAGAHFRPVPPTAAQARSYTGWSNDLEDFLYRTQSATLLRCQRLKLVAKLGESETDFRARVGEALRAEHDVDAAAVQKKYAAKSATLEERLRKAEAMIEKQKAQSHQAQMNVVLKVGSSILGGLFGGRRSSSVTKVEQSIRGAGRAMEEQGDVGRAGDTAKAVQEQLDELKAQEAAEVAALGAADGSAEPLTTVDVRPRKTDIDVRVCALALTPHWRDASGTLTPAWR